MNVAALALKHARALGLLAAALLISGAIAARALPSAIYPPLQFPRIVIVAHSGTLPPLSMSLIVTRPLEQVVMAVPARAQRAAVHDQKALVLAGRPVAHGLAERTGTLEEGDLRTLGGRWIARGEDAVVGRDAGGA